MAIHSLEFATKFTGELDKALVQKSCVGFLEDNAFGARFVGAKTVKVPRISMQGLGDYDRETGFIKGSVTVENEAFTLTRDRARSFEIDQEDLDETGVANLAGLFLGEFVRTQVAPEIDAYVLSKLAGLSVTKKQTLSNGNLSKPYAAFNELKKAVRNAAGYDEELVCFVSGDLYHAFEASDEISRHLSVTSFRKGGVDLEVRAIDGVALLPVPAARMKSAYTFRDGATGGQEAGGFAPAEEAKDVYMILMPKKACSLVKKSERVRVFTPEQNLKADAYKFDYRIYYDALVKTSYVPAVWSFVAS